MIKMEKIKCFICDEEILEEAIKAPDENFYCENCFNEYWTQADCGHTILKDDVYEVEGKTYCMYCFEQLEIKCDNCGKTILGKDAYIYDNEYYCEECFNDLFAKCAKCGRVIEKETAFKYAGDYYCDDCLNDYFVECAECGEIIHIEDAQEYEGRYYCNYCFEENYVMCYQCGHIVPIDDAFYYETVEEYYCNDCFNDYFVRCDNCGEWIHESYAYSDDNITICRYCRENYFLICDGCRNYVHERDAHYNEDSYSYYCDNCWEEIESENRVIYNYNYKPRPVFYGSDDKNALFLGVELEVDGGGENNDNAQEIVNIMDDFIYIKYDGSLDDGFEIVSHPATLEYHRKEAYWDEALQELLRMGYKSHDAETCGLHVHLSRRAFGSSETEQDSNIMKLLYIFEKFWPQFVKFSRRTEAQLNRWAARYGLTDPLDELLDTAKYAGRYHAINLQPYNTIEIRLFRGTLKYNTFIATLEFCQYLYDTVINSSIEELQQMTWRDFIKAIPEDYQELLIYLEERKLIPQAEEMLLA
jgi:formylmethanofuran dehydrogenase subunit E